MAYDGEGFGVLGYCNGFTLWHYRSQTDTNAAMKADGYFNGAADLVRPGDVILFQDRDDRIGMRQVSVHTETEVHTAALA